MIGPFLQIGLLSAKVLGTSPPALQQGVLAAKCRVLAHLNLPDSRAQIQYTKVMKRGSLKRTETL